MSTHQGSYVPAMLSKSGPGRRFAQRWTTTGCARASWDPACERGTVVEGAEREPREATPTQVLPTADGALAPARRQSGVAATTGKSDIPS